MPNLQFVKKNRITQELDTDVARRRKVVLTLGALAGLAGLVLVPADVRIGFFGVLFVLVAIAFALAGSRDAVKQSGALGEDYTLKSLLGLPDSYTIFNQVEVPDERSRTGRREVDFIVCGPNGVFVIESKNHNGTLTGSEHDERWTIHKVGRGGTPYSDTVLNKYLQRKKLNPWITGVVSLSSNNDTSGIDSSVPVVASAHLAHWLTEYRGKAEVRDLDRVVQAISELG